MTTEYMTPDEWLDRVRKAESGVELLDWIRRRVANPYREGPPLNDRDHEVPENVFEQLCQNDDGFRGQLEDAAQAFFNSDEPSPEDSATIPLLRVMLGLVQRQALTGANGVIRAWFARYEGSLRNEPGGYLARAALGALATSQPRGVRAMYNFWLRIWRWGPREWQPRAFIGLRLQDPDKAAEEIPELVQRFKPDALLHGLWKQPNGRDAISRWLKRYPDSAAARIVRGVLKEHLVGNEPTRVALKSRRPVASLCPDAPQSWS